MPAGPEAAFRTIEPLLRVLGKNIFYLGADPSLGQTMKIINNTLYATSMIASCEALVYGAKAGLDAKTMLDVINVSSGRSFATLERIPQCVLDRSFPTRFTTELLHKDVAMCLDEAIKLGDRILILREGAQVAQYDTPEAILSAWPSATSRSPPRVRRTLRSTIAMISVAATPSTTVIASQRPRST